MNVKCERILFFIYLKYSGTVKFLFFFIQMKSVSLCILCTVESLVQGWPTFFILCQIMFTKLRMCLKKYLFTVYNVYININFRFFFIYYSSIAMFFLMIRYVEFASWILSLHSLV
jgi:hypothetical protein